MLSTFFISIFICITILLWKNCKLLPNRYKPSDEVNQPFHDYHKKKEKNMIVFNDNQSFVSDMTCLRSEFTYQSSTNCCNNININDYYATFITAPNSELVDEHTLSDVMQNGQNRDKYFEDEASSSVDTFDNTSAILCSISQKYSTGICTYLKFLCKLETLKQYLPITSSSSF